METGTNVAHPHTDRPLTPGAPASLCYRRDRSQSVVDRHTVVTLIAPRGRRLHVQEGSRTPPPAWRAGAGWRPWQPWRGPAGSSKARTAEKPARPSAGVSAATARAPEPRASRTELVRSGTLSDCASPRRQSWSSPGRHPSSLGHGGDKCKYYRPQLFKGDNLFLFLGTKLLFSSSFFKHEV